MRHVDLSFVEIRARAARLVVLDLLPGRDVPAASVLGSIEMDGARQRFASFRRNTAFAGAYARYMRGERSVRPSVLDDARVTPGEHVYVIDPRTPTPDGRVPWTDVVGWYESDAAGEVRASTFTYNAEHALVTPDGRWSGILDDAKLAAVLTEESAGG